MKKLELLCVGKIKEKYFNDGISEYIKRLGKYAEVTVTEIPDVKDDGRSAEIESKAILSKLSGYVILTDLRGKMLTSEEFSDLIDSAYLTASKVQVVIGGSRGVTEEVRKRADALVAFGKMTYPHRLMRLIVAEQVYRAFSIVSGSEYHK
ncbi:MAG: 23S rRNA (pseudouridine(1915)-N(3))-methyltransferase RlmH [Clostridia bacterium]|nr:23S rRNA (pseudouridine(1915)-N(3))-methyltransferase RlmH [Clostridia bacterium]